MFAIANVNRRRRLDNKKRTNRGDKKGEIDGGNEATTERLETTR